MAITVENTATHLASSNGYNFSIPTPAANNLLVVMATTQSGSQVIETPTGFTRIQAGDDGSAQHHGELCYKIADGTETSINASYGNTKWFAVCYAEISGLDATAPLEDSDEDESQIAATATSVTSGSATPTTADGWAVAGVSGGNSNKINGGRAWSNSFADIVAQLTTSNFRPGSVLAKLEYSSASAKTTTYSHTDAGGWLYGAIGVFKAAGGGGGLTTSDVSVLDLTATLSAPSSLRSLVSNIPTL